MGVWLLTGRVLAKWFRSSSMSEQFSLGQESEDFVLGESPTDLTPSDIRFSIMSNDSGIERDLPPSSDPFQSSPLDSANLTASYEQCKRWIYELVYLHLFKTGFLDLLIWKSTLIYSFLPQWARFIQAVEAQSHQDETVGEGQHHADAGHPGRPREPGRRRWM